VVDLPRGGFLPTHGSPALWALGLLAGMVGVPFVVLAVDIVVRFARRVSRR